MVDASSDTSSVVSSAEKLKESFDALLFMLVSVISTANINLLWLKLKINLFLQYARETTPEVQPILDNMEDRCHSPEGVILFLVNRNLLGYLNFELLNVFKQFLTENYEIIDKIAEYKSKHKVFICQNLKNSVQRKSQISSSFHSWSSRNNSQPSKPMARKILLPVERDNGEYSRLA